MQNLMVKTGARYRKATAAEVAEVHSGYALAAVNAKRPSVNAPAMARTFFREILGGLDYEVFAIALLDTRHRVITVETMFRGTVDGASVHPREVVRAVIFAGAAAVIFAHNHPSGVAEPSTADELITRRLRDALAMIDVRVLDHLIIGLNSTCSFAERGML